MIIEVNEKESGEIVSDDTVERALHDVGYSFKRAKKSAPVNLLEKFEQKQYCRKIS